MKSRLRNLVSIPGCDYLEIRLEDSKRTDFRYLGRQLEDLRQASTGGAAIRALKGGAWAFACVEDLTQLEDAVKTTVRAAHAAAKVNQGQSRLAAVTAREVEIKAHPANDPRAMGLEQKLALFGAYNERMLGVAGITSTMTSYFEMESRIRLATSDGTWVDREVVDFAYAAAAIARRGGDTRTGAVINGSKGDFGIVKGIEHEIDAAVAEALGKLDAPVITAGTYTVVCDPTLAGVFVHEAFGHLSEGDNLADDANMREILTLGRRFGAEYLNIYDTGLDSGIRGHLPVDDEGVPGQRTELITKGVLTGRLHSRETAGKLGEAATGNCRAISYRHPPIPRMRNTCIAPGPHGTLNDMIRDVKLGVYAVGSSGGQTNGELFTFTARDAFMIRDGAVAERVKDVTISGNVFDTLRNIDRIGSDFAVRDGFGGCGKAGQAPLPVSHGSPHIRIQNCVIGGK
jgi:TldD protein